MQKRIKTLEDENKSLKTELDNLHSEVAVLKDLVTSQAAVADLRTYTEGRFDRLEELIRT